jgi:hypothetical protein
VSGTLEIPAIGNKVASEDPKVKTAIETLNNLFEASNKITAAGLSFRPLIGRISGAGAVVSGTGFTSEKNETGVYTVKFTSEFSATPVLLITPETGSFNLIAVNAEVASPKKEAKIRIKNSANEAKDSAFAFTASLPV